MIDECPKCHQPLLLKGKDWGFCDMCCIEIKRANRYKSVIKRELQRIRRSRIKKSYEKNSL